MSTIAQENDARINEIVKNLDGNLKNADQENRRRAQRVPLRMNLTVIILTGGSGPQTSVEVHSRNISSSGIGFVCRRMFRSEERIAILLRIPKMPNKLLLARVTFSRYINGGLYEMGAEFLECISDPTGSERIPNEWLLAAGQARTPFNTSPSPSAAAPAAGDAAVAAATAAVSDVAAKPVNATAVAAVAATPAKVAATAKPAAASHAKSGAAKKSH